MVVQGQPKQTRTKKPKTKTKNETYETGLSTPRKSDQSGRSSWLVKRNNSIHNQVFFRLANLIGYMKTNKEILLLETKRPMLSQACKKNEIYETGLPTKKISDQSGRSSWLVKRNSSIHNQLFFRLANLIGYMYIFLASSPGQQ